MNKRLMEITARKAELLKELDGEVTEERMKEINTEVDSLAAEEKQIRSKEDLIGRLGNPEAKPEGRTADSQDEEEKRCALIKESGKMTIGAAQVRSGISARYSRSTTIDSDTLVKPTLGGTEIHDNMQQPSSIIDMVTALDLTGCNSYQEAYVKSDPEASNRTDGVANTTSDPIFRVAEINPYVVNVTCYVSKNINRLSPTNYTAKIQSLALKALRTKAGAIVTNGVPGKVCGIKIAKNTKDEAIYKTLNVASAEIGATTLRDIVFAYGGDDSLGGNAVLFLTKEDLAAFGKVRGTNEKKAIYEITPDPSNANTGTIKDGGTIVPYCICSKLTSLSTSTKGSAAVPTMLYGDPANYEMGLFGAYTIEVSRDYKFAEGLLTIMGEAMIGGNLIVDEGFIVVTLAAN